MSLPLRSLQGLLLGLWLIGCNGVIGDPAADAPIDRRLGDPEDPRFCELAGREPGRITVRRLNRVEYDNTVRDLLGDTSRPARSFPTDDESGDGFDNNAEVLTIGALLMEKYEAATKALVIEALRPASSIRARYLDCDPGTMGARECGRRFARELGLRAWRRPLADAEVERLADFVDVAQAEGLTFDDGIALEMRAMLLSPNFLFRIERGTESAEVVRLDGFEVASRLSYFLWSSMPDEELLADADGLDDEASLRAQVDRMLADPKAQGFYESFAGQWLRLRGLDYTTPDPALFPDFDEELRDAMRMEATLYVQHIIETNAPVAQLMRSDFTFLNERLARHYEIEGVTGDAFRRVELTDGRRGGLLTMGGILTVTSHPDMTSPVKRGVWVLDMLMCEPPAAPPPDVDTLIERSASDGLTLRDRLAQHRANPACATCHDLMDPIGLALENYDATGAWRELDNGLPIDATGELPGGQTFDGAGELASLLREDERYTACVTKKLLTYALGRSLAGVDRCIAEGIVQQAGLEGMSMRELIVQLVISDVFRSGGGRTEAGR